MSRKSSLPTGISATYHKQAITYMCDELGYDKPAALLVFNRLIKCQTAKSIADAHATYGASLNMNLSEFSEFIQGKHLLGTSKVSMNDTKTTPQTKQELPVTKTANKTIDTTAVTVKVDVKPSKMKELKEAVCRRMGHTYTDSKSFKKAFTAKYGTMPEGKLNCTETWSKLYDLQTNTKRIDEGKVQPPKQESKTKSKKQPTKAELIDEVLDTLRAKLEKCTKAEVIAFAEVLATQLNK